MSNEQTQSEADRLLEWLASRPTDQLEGCRLGRYDETTTAPVTLVMDGQLFMGASFIDCLREAKAFLKPTKFVGS